MKFRTLSTYFAAFFVTILLLFGVRAVQSNLDRQVGDCRLRYTGNIKNAPPLVAVTTVVLGSFRGMIADLLWLRTDSLKNKHNYYEMVQLAQWITDLQPSFSGATCFLAWNMAYNISVTCSSPIERWRWVNEGIDLLRDKALEYNPDDPRIYKELAWIFAHKLGNVMDDANLYYKNRLAVEMQNVFGRFPEWEKIAAAPADRDEFLRRHPATAPLWALVPGANLDEKYDRLYEAFRKSAATPAPEAPPAFLGSVGGEVLDYLRAELLRRHYRLDPKKILAINREYGELDWRTPEAQAIYWARESLDRSVTLGGKREINTERIINNGLYQSFLAGRVMMTDPDLDKKEGIRYLAYPNLSLVDAVYRIYTDSQEYHDSEDRKSSSFRTARINFLKEAVYILSAFGAFGTAEKYYKLLVDDDGPQKVVIGNKEIVCRNLTEFVKAEWIETIKNANAKQAGTFLSGLLYSCIINEIRGDHDAALLYKDTAQYVYNYYVERIGNNARMEIPPLPVLRREIQEWCLEVLSPAEVRRLKSIIAEEEAEKRLRQALPPAAAPVAPAAPAAPGK